MSGLAPRSSQRGCAAARRDHAQAHADVGIAGGRIALLDHFGAVGVDLGALLDRHLRLRRCARRRSPNRPAPTSSRCGGPFPRRRRTRRRRWRSCRRRRWSGASPCRRPGRSLHRSRSRTKLTKPPFGDSFGSVAKPSPWVSWRTAAVPVLSRSYRYSSPPSGNSSVCPSGRPLVFDDAATARRCAGVRGAPSRRPTALPGRPAATRESTSSALFAAGDVDLPQVEAVLVVLLAAQEGQAPAVGREAPRARARAR